MTETVVETWRGVSLTHGPVECDVVRFASGHHHYQPRYADGTLVEIKTIGLSDVEFVRRFALEMGYACRDVPEWTGPDGVVIRSKP